MGRARQSPARRFLKIVPRRARSDAPYLSGNCGPARFGKRWKNWFWKGCKPNSVCPLARGENHLSVQPIPGILPRWRDWSGPLRDSLFGLAPDGVFRAASLAFRAVRSYRTFSPLPASLARHRRFDFLWHCPSKSLSTFRPRVSRPHRPGLRGIAPFGVRTFLPRLAPGAILHPSKTN